MPYALRRSTAGGYRVVNTATGKVHAEHTTKRRAMAQIRLLNGLEHGMRPRERTR